MTVIELLFSVDREALLDRWNDLYENDFEDRAQGLAYLDRALEHFKKAVPVRTGMKLIVETQRAQWTEKGRSGETWMTEERGSMVDVSGTGIESDELDYKGDPYPIDTRWALGFTNWGELREMEVIQNPHDEKMPDLDLAAHVIEELTWHGLPAAQEERRDEVMDRIEEFHRSNERAASRRT